MQYTHASGKFVQGLANRRSAERKICLTPDSAPSASVPHRRGPDQQAEAHSRRATERRCAGSEARAENLLLGMVDRSMTNPAVAILVSAFAIVMVLIGYGIASML
jgi:hypothetical protein